MMGISLQYFMSPAMRRRIVLDNSSAPAWGPSDIRNLGWCRLMTVSAVSRGSLQDHPGTPAGHLPGNHLCWCPGQSIPFPRDPPASCLLPIPFSPLLRTYVTWWIDAFTFDFAHSGFKCQELVIWSPFIVNEWEIGLYISRMIFLWCKSTHYSQRASKSAFTTNTYSVFLQGI